MPQVWVVRAGLKDDETASYFGKFKEYSLVGTGTTVSEDLSRYEDEDDEAFKETCKRICDEYCPPEEAPHEALQLYWFAREIKPFDIVITPLKAQKQNKDWHIAVVPLDSQYYFHATDGEELRQCPYYHYRKVLWTAFVNGKRFPSEIQTQIDRPGSVLSIDKSVSIREC
jgi:predicted Mrr-cat superfamily restriction endonuclease